MCLIAITSYVSTSYDKVVGLLERFSVDFTATSVISRAQIVHFEAGNGQRKVISVDPEVLPVGVTIVHARVAGENRFPFMASVKNLCTIVKYILALVLKRWRSGVAVRR